MMTADELKAVSAIAKANKEVEIFCPIIEKINHKIIERATEGFTDISEVDCEELYGSIPRKDWGCLTIIDFNTFFRKYYTELGYAVSINTYTYNKKITWRN